MARRGEEVLIWDKYTQESLETLSGDLLRVLGCSRSTAFLKRHIGATKYKGKQDKYLANGN